MNQREPIKTSRAVKTQKGLQRVSRSYSFKFLRSGARNKYEVASLALALTKAFLLAIAYWALTDVTRLNFFEV